MNDVNLNNPNLKLVNAGDQAPVKALSSSQAEGRNAPDLAASSAGARQVQNTQIANEASKAEQLKERNDTRKLDPAIDEQFSTGRLYALITSRPGQCGRCDGYILEGKELEFYLRQLAHKCQAREACTATWVRTTCCAT